MWSAIAVFMRGYRHGIFLVPSEMARDWGSGARVLAGWAIGGVAVVVGTLCYAELGADAGGIVRGAQQLQSHVIFLGNFFGELRRRASK